MARERITRKHSGPNSFGGLVEGWCASPGRVKNPKIRPLSHPGIRDFTDNAIRHFRMTGMFAVRGGGRHIDIEPPQTEMNFWADKFSAAPIPPALIRATLRP